ncbi:MAG TPA: alpha/beta family hydrolase [Actinomycetota bacterium]|nr:alpha/beta family hydrolase [Actinomycetota bacterium]
MGAALERFSFGAEDRTLSGLWIPPRTPVAVAVLAHGAGAGMEHPFMAGAAEGLAEGGVTTMRFNFPYVEEGRRSPDRPPVLLQAWRRALEEAQRRSKGLPIAAGGKSLGGRMASMLAAEEKEGFAGGALVFFGYPLHAPGKADQPRDAHLPRVTVPMLFIQGTDDALARFDLIEELVQRLGSRARLHTIKGGNHSFRVRGARRPDAETGKELGAVAAEFLREVLV